MLIVNIYSDVHNPFKRLQLSSLRMQYFNHKQLAKISRCWSLMRLIRLDHCCQRWSSVLSVLLRLETVNMYGNAGLAKKLLSHTGTVKVTNCIEYINMFNKHARSQLTDSNCIIDIRPCQIGILLSLNSSLTNLGSYSQKHTNRKWKHIYFTTKTMHYIYIFNKRNIIKTWNNGLNYLWNDYF